AGAEAAPDAARELVALLRRTFGVPVALLNDGLAAHVGAFAGAPGTVLIAGTGAVAFGVNATGGIRQVDGLGPWLGDEGSGCWLGRSGLQAALRAGDGRGPETLLRLDAEALAGGLDRLPQWVAASGTPARTLASFAPRVLDRAAEGDATAVGIVDTACAFLTRTVAAAAEGDSTVVVTGGLLSHSYFSTRLDIALAAVNLARVAALGDALSGAAIVAGRTGLPHERTVIRG
ncbi:N-acetylglucosamine kinase, partial [Cryobacterium sp. MLB-32]|uniref:N-acetylglucosamine kinase n=1 Tax=Cryobacterium sp. MLB-32 TaxID=1529318 RepID=UPI000565DDA7